MLGSKWRIYVAVIAVILVAASGSLQTNGLLAINGIRPNLVLVTLLVSAFLVDSLALYALLTLLASITVSVAPGFSLESLAIALIGFLVFFLRKRMVWSGLWGSAIVILFGTIATYAIVSPWFLYQNPAVVLFETVYNMVLGFILYELLQLMTRYEKRSSI